MIEWIAVGATCVAIIALLVFADRAERSALEKKPTENDGQPKAETKARVAAKTDDIPPAPDSRDSIKSTTIETKPTTTEKAAAAKGAAVPELPRLDYEEDEDVDPTKVGPQKAAGPKAHPPTKKIVYDEDAATEDPTRPGDLILVCATAQTDKGVRRKRNEDSLLVMPNESVYVVADGMGGYSGGEIASSLAVKTIESAFKEEGLGGERHEGIPSRASELAHAIQAANEAILARASEDKKLEGMGTTICAARFSPNKQRLYVAHVGDSRMYRMRSGKLRQMTSDHTMKDFGMTGPGSDHLSRAVGVWPTVPVDILLAKPVPGDIYLLCSDGLTKMVDDGRIAELLGDGTAPEKIAEGLVREANARGGKDNITAILVQVYPPPGSRPET
jgi:protein phosphatase